MKRALALVGLALLAGCMGPAANPHYQLGRAYQLKGIWYYPNESYDLDDTGLAAMFGSGHPPLTANGEVFDQSVVMAGHATLQLPAIARLTNLENGRSVLVRINDRGTGNPGRLVEVTNRTAILLDMRDRSATRMRLLVLPVESRAAVDAIPGAPALALTAAPRGAVTASVLAPPPGVAALADRTTPPVVTAAAEVRPAAPAAIARLPETVTQEEIRLNRLWVRLDTFEEYHYAASQRARMSNLGAGIESAFDGRVHRYWVRIGPLDTVRQADDALRDALAKGIPDARIVVE